MALCLSGLFIWNVKVRMFTGCMSFGLTGTLSGCKINYHHDFFVKAGRRTYYDTITDVLQIGEHQFAETRLIRLWRTNMNIAWYVIYSVVSTSVY
jgi:hypothetical protein